MPSGGGGGGGQDRRGGRVVGGGGWSKHVEGPRAIRLGEEGLGGLILHK